VLRYPDPGAVAGVAQNLRPGLRRSGNPRPVPGPEI